MLGNSYEEQLKLIFNEVSYQGFKWNQRNMQSHYFLVFKIRDKFIKNNNGGMQLANTTALIMKINFLSNLNLANSFSIALNQRQDLCDKYKIKCITFISPMPGFFNIHKHKSISLEYGEKMRNIFKALILIILILISLILLNH